MHPKLLFITGNKRNRRLRRVESQSPGGEENLSETSILQGNATLTNVSENVDNVFDRNLCSELTEPSHASNEIEISQKLTERNNTKMSQIKEHLNSKLEEILKEIRASKNCNREKDDEICDPGCSNLRNEHLKKKYASNIENNSDRIQDNRVPSSNIDMDELRQPSTPFGVANETLEDTIIINKNRQEADYHSTVLKKMTWNLDCNNDLDW